MAKAVMVYHSGYGHAVEQAQATAAAATLVESNAESRDRLVSAGGCG